MSSDDFQVQNVYRYCRKSYKKSRRSEDVNAREDEFVVDSSPRPTSTHVHGNPGCSCELDPEGEIASILHKKCPVISLAQQQLQRLLDGTDRMMIENSRCCRSLFELFCMCKEVLLSQNRCQYILVFLILVAFLLGLLFGAASCGVTLRQFNSPILHCIDSYFLPDTYNKISYRAIM